MSFTRAERFRWGSSANWTSTRAAVAGADVALTGASAGALLRVLAITGLDQVFGP